MIASKGGLLVERVGRELHAQVTRMAAAGEAALPKESELATQYGVSMKTIRSAMHDLKRQRLVKAIPGKGTFVVPKSERQQLTVVFCRNISHPYSAVATQVIMDELRARDMPGAVSVLDEPRVPWSSLGFAPRDVGGILALGQHLDPAWLGELFEAGTPLVVLDDFGGSLRLPPRCHQVLSDSRAASFLAARHLLQAGHRRMLLACWGGNSVWGADLLRGHREALGEAGIAFDPALHIDLPIVRFDTAPAHYIEALGGVQTQLDALLTAPDAPTAVIHSSSMEIQLREMLHTYFHDRFDTAACVALCAQEHLERGYREGGEAWAAAMPYRRLVNLALDLLRAPPAAPLRLIVDGFRMWHRAEGRWRDEGKNV